MLKKILLLGLLSLGITLQVNAQTVDSVAQVVYLLGNTASTTIPADHLQAFQQVLQAEKNPFTVVHLGDIAANRGIGKRLNAGANQKIDQLLQLTKDRGKMYLVPGDKDWDNSGREGLEDVRRLEQYIKTHQTNAQVLLPSSGCPGPEIRDIGKTIRLIALNTQWWMHPHRKPAEPDTDCGILSDAEFLETLENAITDARGRQIIIVGHHPVLSNGFYGGHVPVKSHFFPFADTRLKPLTWLPLPGLGSLYASYRQNTGTPRDMANPGYQNFIANMNRVFQEHDQLIYAAAHDYSLQLNALANNYHIVSGSFSQKRNVAKNIESQFNRAKTGFAKITTYASGKVTTSFYEFTKSGTAAEVANYTLLQSACNPDPDKAIPVNKQVGPCIKLEMPAPITTEEVTTNGNKATVIAGPQYAAKGLKLKFFGQLYRKSWAQPVQVPLLYLSRTPEKLRPSKFSGGRQTTTLQLQAADGRQFIFRSVDKDPIGAIPPELRNTVVTDVLRQITPTEQPYGALIVSSLLDATDILHAQPKLYVLGDDRVLGPYRKNYQDLFGMLEEQPGDAKGETLGFGGATNLKNSFKLYQELYRDNNNHIDAQAFGKARAFDIFIGDWGRQPDNWRWAGYKTDSQWVYRPIPRDRDHAFSRWDGVIPWLADRKWAIPNIQNFDPEIGGIRSLTWAARHLDRFLLTSLTRQDWLNLAEELQRTFTDAVIDKAIAELPPLIAKAQGQEIGTTLKARRARLPAAMEEYYELLAQYVDVVGTNKNEYFKIERLPDAQVRVQIFRKNEETNLPQGEPYYNRIFFKKETNEIRLYGLGGQDVFDVSGQTAASIRVRIIGGDGQDSIRDVSAVKSYGKSTVVYDNKATKLDLGKEARNLTSDTPDINAFSPTSFVYNAYSPNGSLIYNQSDGVGLALGVTYKRQHFRKKDFASIYSFGARATQFGNLQLTTNTLWRHVVGQWDLGAYLDLGGYFRTYDFFGLGNSTKKNEQLYDDKFYKARYGGVMSSVFVQRQFFQKSYFRIGPLFETLTTNYRDNSFLNQPNGELPPVNTQKQQLIGFNTDFVLDLRDKLIFTQRGIRILVRHNTYKPIKNNMKAYGLTEGFIDYYATGRVYLPVTLALRLGGGRNYGDNLPYYKYTTLGMRSNLRGYVINRFAGDASLYVNSEVRFHLGEVESAFLPFRYGGIAFFDRGRVWYQNKSEGRWHDGYGFGFYIAPVAERFAFSMLLQHSREELLLFSFGAGFRFDQ
ncbi:hypothetical protein [Adhaeribacter radiodurans]|uniref:BamA/TamA family outer membrane protein n=1 Tax=Adhaeribacter radiodurans TaxID=2745197 RepID=A0A7L7L1W8_9BACT|nr:hypothetical protein [Adhaeribacter radiodurans]QMU26786.1 hypothetical protein HUW48_01485 [Adhaeribacter radiodurans]